MRFRYLLSDPHGNIELSPEDLNQPFLTSPTEKHPFLTLKDYFGALQKFILAVDRELLHAALTKMEPQPGFSLTDIFEVIVCSEKHGAFYHIASIELTGPEAGRKFAVITAMAESAKRTLQDEFFILDRLASMNRKFLPSLFCRKTISWQTDAGSVEFLMVLGEWFEGYHEWHVSADPVSGEQKIRLWDYERGCRYLKNSESYELLHQAAYILTYYYDQGSFRQIYPWHHGAGDFVVKAESGRVDVKLVTARQFEPLVHFARQEEADRLVAAIHFLLNLSLRIRLDRLDGTGEPAWLDDFAVQAAVAGFFGGLEAAAAENRLLIGSAADFLAIMQSFDAGEINDMYESLLAIYAEEDQDDFRLITAMLPDHAEQLHKVLQRFSPVKS